MTVLSSSDSQIHTVHLLPEQWESSDAEELWLCNDIVNFLGFPFQHKT